MGALQKMVRTGVMVDTVKHSVKFFWKKSCCPICDYSINEPVFSFLLSAKATEGMHVLFGLTA